MSLERNCGNCDSSWNLSPTHRELKAGIEEGRTICCDVRCAQTMADGVYPRVANHAVEDPSLCGPKMRFWKPVRFVPASPERNTVVRLEDRRKPNYGSAPKPKHKGQGHGHNQGQAQKQRRPYEVKA